MRFNISGGLWSFTANNQRSVARSSHVFHCSRVVPLQTVQMNVTFVQTEDESIEIDCCEESRTYNFLVTCKLCRNAMTNLQRNFWRFFFLAYGFDGLMTID